MSLPTVYLGSRAHCREQVELSDQKQLVAARYIRRDMSGAINLVRYGRRDTVRTLCSALYDLCGVSGSADLGCVRCRLLEFKLHFDLDRRI